MDAWPAAFLILSVCVVAWVVIEVSRPKTLEGAMAKMRLLAFVTSLLSTALGLLFDLWRIDRDIRSDASPTSSHDAKITGATSCIPK